MTEEYVLWKPDQERLYIMECLDDPRFFLHDELLIRPVLYKGEAERPEYVRFMYTLNRVHDIHGCVEKLEGDTLVIRSDDHDPHTFLIRPMNEDDFQRKRRKLDRRDGWPHTHKELFDAYVDEARWG